MQAFNGITRPMLGAGVGRLYGVPDLQLGSIGGEVQVTTSPWERDEFWALLGGSLGWGGLVVAASAGNFSVCQLFNPTSSGVLGFVEGIWISNDNGVTISSQIKLMNAIMPSSSGAWVNRDLRRATTTGGSGSLAMRLRFDQAAAPGGMASQIWSFGQTTLQVTYFPINAILPPGWGIGVTTSAVNLQVNAMFVGRERPAPQQELVLL